MQCEHKPREWVAQWMGAAEGHPSLNLVLPGSHYRGFPTARVCCQCADAMSAGYSIDLWHKGQRWCANEQCCVSTGYPVGGERW